MHTPDALIDAYIDSSIDDDQFEMLCDWLGEDAEHRRVFARKLALHSEIAEWCIERSSGQLAGSLVSLEDEIEVEAGDELPAIHLDATALNKQKYMSALSYAISHTFTPKCVAMFATAAALLLGVALMIVLLSGPKPEQQVVEQPVEPSEVVPVTRDVVATLTDERDAVWDRRPGQDLYAGQRFTLTNGFAEITTNRGAVAILQAPATFEMVDHDNALRLHAGKFVGICETVSSKGFTVHTRHMDVIDLGTRFGIDATRAERVEAHVYEGAIQAVTPSDAGKRGESRVVRVGEAVAVDSANGLISIKTDFTGFAGLLPADPLRPLFAGDPVLWGGPVPMDVSLGQLEANALQVFVEQRAMLLDQDVVVDMVASEQWPTVEGIGQRTVKAGHRVDVYLLHLDPVGEGSVIEGSYVIRFDRPILGVMGSGKTLRASDRYFSEQVTFPTPFKTHVPAGGGSGLDIKPSDFATISDDGKTLTMELNAREMIDQIRVLVQTHDAAASPAAFD